MTESQFEREVLHRLASAGYSETTQVKSGYYRIDMVVEGGGKLLAVECDGGRWCPIEEWAQDAERRPLPSRRASTDAIEPIVEKNRNAAVLAATMRMRDR
jgi:hypothetical protein